VIRAQVVEPHRDDPIKTNPFWLTVSRSDAACSALMVSGTAMPWVRICDVLSSNLDWKGPFPRGTLLGHTVVVLKDEPLIAG
jgi:hypothetical protein